MTTTPPSDPAAEDAIRTQVERLIIENRNSLNDPTTNEPFDIQGIADDVVALILEARIDELNNMPNHTDVNLYVRDRLAQLKAQDDPDALTGDFKP